MPYKMTVYFRGMPKAISDLRTLDRYLKREAGKEVTRGAFNAAGDIFDKNFQTEGKAGGLGGWAALRESTQREREALGFGGAHPIMIRYGDLRSIVASSLRDATGSATFTATDPQGGSISVSLNVGKAGGYAIASGDKAGTQGARPFWFTTQPVTRAVRREAEDVLSHGVEHLF
jgi:hypothetical protein